MQQLREWPSEWLEQLLLLVRGRALSGARARVKREDRVDVPKGRPAPTVCGPCGLSPDRDPPSESGRADGEAPRVRLACHMNTVRAQEFPEYMKVGPTMFKTQEWSHRDSE